MSAFVKIDVAPDTPEWEAERRNSIGASELPAVLGLSPYGVTALDVYKHKLGIDRPFDPILSFVGHQSEAIVEAWLREFSGLDLDIQPGFMARSVEWPFLHASFDRVALHPFTPIQIKTASAYAGHHWDEGVPTDVRVQVQGELAVSGAPRALVAVWIGGREFRIFWEHRDDRFILEYLVPAAMNLWDAHVRAQVPPEPMTLADVNSIPTDRDVEVELSDEAFEVLERITVLNSDIEAQQQERDALKVALAQYTGPAGVLNHGGRRVATWRMQKGRTSLDTRALRQVHPDIVNEFTVQGAPFRVLRRMKSQGD